MLKKNIFIGLAFLGLSCNLFAKSHTHDLIAVPQAYSSSSLTYLKVGTIFYDPYSVGLGYRYKMNYNGIDISATTSLEYLKNIMKDDFFTSMPYSLNASYLRYLNSFLYLGIGGNYTHFGNSFFLKKHNFHPNAALGLQFGKIFIESNAHFFNIQNGFQNQNPILNLNIGFGF